MAIPPLAGWWGDSRWGTAPWLLIAGAVLGFLSGMLSIWKLSADFSRPKRPAPPMDGRRD